MPLMSMPRICAGDRLGLVRAAGELDAAGLAAAADEDLGLDDDPVGTVARGRPRAWVARLGRRACHGPAGHRQAGCRRAAVLAGTPAASRTRRRLRLAMGLGSVRIARHPPAWTPTAGRPRRGREIALRLAGRASPVTRTDDVRAARSSRPARRPLRLDSEVWMLLRTAAAKGCLGLAVPPHQRHRRSGSSSSSTSSTSTSSGGNPHAYDDLLAFYASPVGRVMEVLLGAALLYHALNGLRILSSTSGRP